MALDLLMLFFIFFKVGLFTIGGGLAAIPLIQEYIVNTGMLTNTEFANMIAISESTPGPIGVNVATFVGFSLYGPLGSIIATIGIVTPSVVIIIIIAHFLKKFKDSDIVKGIFVGIRPAVTALILAAAYFIARIAFFNSTEYELSNSFFSSLRPEAILIFLGFLFVSNKWKHHPIFYIVIGAIIGMIIY